MEMLLLASGSGEHSGARHGFQAAGYRVSYSVTAIRASPNGRDTLATGHVSGSVETGLRLSLRDERVEVETLFGISSEADSVLLTAEFASKRRLGASRRGLPLWEQDEYTRQTRLAWGDTARVYPFGRTQDDGTSLWVEVGIHRQAAGGETRPGETIEVSADAGLEIALEAVTRPRRAVVIVNLVRGDLVSGPRRYDLVPEGPPWRLAFVLAGRRRLVELSLIRPEPARQLRDRVLAGDADVVCLRVFEPEGGGGGGQGGSTDEVEDALPAGVLCGRLNNVARRLPMAGGDTLVATFAWPGYR